MNQYATVWNWPGGAMEDVMRGCWGRAIVAAAVLAVVSLGAAPSARADGGPARDATQRADEAPRRTWQPRREMNVSAADVGATVAGVGVIVGAAAATPRSDHLYGGVVFDEDARDTLRLGTANGRGAAKTTSDVALATSVALPLVVDAVVVSWAYRGDVRLGRDLAIVSAEALALTGALQGVTNNLASRERPYGRLCGSELAADSAECTGTVRYRSFFSGHAAMSFAGASALCANHVGLGLLGGPWDVLSCAIGYSIATTTAFLRVAGDMHYASDVIVGAGVGTAIGLATPFLHFGPRRGGPSFRVAPVGTGTGTGIGVAGAF
jgi:membrane-associated phospholipid phosphatase